jgi:hypothetical protein
VLGILTKLSTLPALAVAAGSIVMIDRRPRRDRRIDLTLAACLVLLVAGPYLSWALEQRHSPLSLDAWTIPDARIPGPDEVGGRLAYLTQIYWDLTFESYWGRFGWLSVQMPKAIYLGFFALTWTGLLGYYAGRVREANALLRERAFHAYLVMTVAMTLLGHAALNLFVTAPDGSALFAAAPHFGLLLALGIGRLLGHENRTLALTITIVAALIAIDFYCLRSVLIPAYAMR